MAKRTRKQDCSPDVLEAIRRAYPRHVVTFDMVHDEPSYYDEIRMDVRDALMKIEGTDVLYDRPPEGRPHWEKGADPDEDPPSWVEESSSYDLVFLGLRGDQFQFTSDFVEDVWVEDAEDFVETRVPTEGRIGCAVGISIVAPFAVVHFTEIEFDDEGDGTMPDIWPHIFDLDGTELDIEAHYRELFLDEGIAALRALREEVAQVLGSFGIRLLSKDELATRIRGLKPNPELAAVTGEKTATVCGTLFFLMD